MQCMYTWGSLLLSRWALIKLAVCNFFFFWLRGYIYTISHFLFFSFSLLLLCADANLILKSKFYFTPESTMVVQVLCCVFCLFFGFLGGFLLLFLCAYLYLLVASLLHCIQSYISMSVGVFYCICLSYVLGIFF